LNSAESFDLVKKWLKVFNPQCDIVYVQSAQDLPGGFADQSNTLQKYFAEFNPQFHFIGADNAETGVLNFIAEKKPDLVIVLPEKHGHFGFLFHTSISRKLVLRAHLPVLSVILQLTENNSISKEDQEGNENKKHDCSVCNGACKKMEKKTLRKI
ncbi:MAG TPA: universal stress protein, partial [Puia sp.]